MARVSVKVVGASGQGINSIGEVLAKAFKRSGFCVFGYREYPSLIKGGHASYQLDVSGEGIESSETGIDVLITLNHHGLELNLREVKERGVIVHFVPDWKFGKSDREFLKKRKITVVELPVFEILKKLNARPILGNILLASFVWALFDQSPERLKRLTREQFGKKGEEIVKMNHQCIDAGVAAKREHAKKISLKLPKAAKKWSEQLLVTGSQAMGLGLIHAGCRFYAGYPMTPSSPLLKFIADIQGESGMVVKQAEDEITAAQMMSGAFFMGTRAITATSGGGFDLMTETMSMNGIIENPSVFVLAQRPGPATGLPTWTAQGDLLLAVGSAHGEFARCVMSVSDSEDCFSLMSEACNLAEEFRISVIVVTDKQIAEALYTQEPFDQNATEIRRGVLVIDPKKLKMLKGEDYFDPKAKNGVSLRWLPGAEAETYCAQADEHSGDGSVDESSRNATAQMEKRMRKMSALKERLPEPELYLPNHQSPITNHQGTSKSQDPSPDVLLVSWGSNKGVILDVMEELNQKLKTKNYKLAYLHYTYLWPMKTERFKKLASMAKKVILVECNKQGQLGMFLKQESGIEIKDKILKYDGRPFFFDELLSLIRQKL